MLYLLVFGVTFENWDPFNLSGTLSITRIVSVFYLLSCIPFLKSEFNFHFLRKYIIPLMIFIIIAVVTTAFNGIYADSPMQLINLRLIQLIFLMLLIANHILSGEIKINYIFYVFLSSVIFMYFLFLLGIGVEFEHGRLILFGENPNAIGMKAAAAFLILLTLFLDLKNSIWKWFFLITGSLALLNLVILSASRGAFATIILGVALVIIFSKISMGRKLVLFTLGSVFIIGFVNYILLANPVFAERILRTVETGDTGRNHLWIAAVQVIGNNPYMGVGLQGVLPEMFKYSGRFADPHNTFLWIFITTGIFGFLCFLSFLGILGTRLFKSFKSHGRIIFMLLFSIIIINMAKSGGGIINIFFWFMFAVLVGSTKMEGYMGANSIS